MMTLAALIAGGLLLGQRDVKDSDGSELPDVSQLSLLSDEAGPLIMRMSELDAWPTTRPGPYVRGSNYYSPWVYRDGNHQRFMDDREYGCVRRVKVADGESLLLVRVRRTEDDSIKPMTVAGWAPADNLERALPIEDGEGRRLTGVAELSARRDPSGRAMLVWTPSLDLRPTIRPGVFDPKKNPHSPWSGRARMNFMDSFVCVAESEAAGGRSLLLARWSGDSANPQLSELAGWLPASRLVLSPNARTLSGNRAPEKVLIVDNLAARRREEKTGPLETRCLRLGPDSKALVRANVPLTESMSWRFVYAVDGEWSLLGSQPSFDPQEPAAVVLGWLRTEQLCVWPSREALALDPRPGQNLTLVFQTGSEARANNGQPLLRETAAEARPRGLAPPPSFPILSSQRLPNGNRLYEIAAVGNLDEGRRNAGAGSGADPGGELIDILFVIDATDSNQDFFPGIKSAVDQIIRSFQDATRRIERRPGAAPPRLRLAVSSYTDGRNAFKVMPLVDADKALDLVARKLDSWRVKDPANIDFPERVYGGLNDAINAAGFADYAVKLVVLMGDAPDKHQSGDPSLENLVERMAPFQGPELPIYFRAVHTHKPDVEANGNVLFRELFQFREDIQLLSKRVGDRIRDANPGGRNSDLFCGYEELSPKGLQVVAALADPQRLRDLVAQAANRAEQIRRQRRDWPLESAPALSRLLQEAKLDRASLAAQGVFDICVKGYTVDSRDGRWRKQVLVNGRELREIAALLRELNQAAAMPAAVSQAVSDALKARGMKPDQALNDWLLGFMDYNFKSLVLSDAPRAVARMSAADIKQEMNHLRDVSERLDNVLRGVVDPAGRPERAWRFLNADDEWP